MDLVRINKYLAEKKYCTRREADALIVAGKVSINGRLAVLGDKVAPEDRVEVRFRPKKYRYFAYNKPRGIITHSPQYAEKAIADVVDLEGVFPVGRLDKDSEGLIILTDDGRLTEALLGPEQGHEKEYEVMTAQSLPNNFKKRMEGGVNIDGYVTKPCKVEIRGNKKFRIILTEGKKHQIRRMCDVVAVAIVALKRVRIGTIALGALPSGEYRELAGTELHGLLREVGLAR